ncbi:hypothetical protein P3T36_003517 [Kitasatospora sp. MAP12-15]|uniref:hypothetical protein n=1 Tax=unclassified Kitasatospora TaxID=2633591 RepID=UPI0024761DB2|nr:hypothetical protein [Kitasatospora sp. MAP12-44]MDH6110479.1 hypothetical protein [Kitasatospora sp. MAP12-44]
MEAIGAVIALLVLFGIGIVTLLIVAAVKAGKAVVDTVGRTEANARRAVENVTLKAKTFSKPGAAGRIAGLRLSVRTALSGTREVLEAGVGADSQLTEALQLLSRLDEHAAELDAELRMLEREPESGRVAAKLPELGERAERIIRSAESMRWAAQDRMHRFADDELTRLSQDCESEAGALRHWDTGAASGAATGAATGAAAPGIAAAGGRLSAEEMLGLAEPLTRFAQRLRKPNPGSSAS